MKRWIIWSCVIGTCIAGGVWLHCRAGPTYVLCIANIELQLLVIDAENHQPVPGAIVEIHDDDEQPPGVTKLITDENGRADHVHKDKFYERIIRPCSKKVIAYDLTWASVRVSAKGYKPIEAYLHGMDHEDMGRARDELLERLRFTIALEKTTPP